VGPLLDGRLPDLAPHPLAVDEDEPFVTVGDDKAREDLAVRQRERGGAETIGDLLRREEYGFDQLRLAVGGGDPGQVGTAFAPLAVHPVTLDASRTPGVPEQDPATPRVARVGAGEGGVVVRLPSSMGGRKQRRELAVAGAQRFVCVNQGLARADAARRIGAPFGREILCDAHAALLA